MLEDGVLRGPGEADSRIREAVAGDGEIPAELVAVVDKIERHPYGVTEEDIAALKSKYSEDEIFEIVVSAALGASRRRLQAGLRALEEA
jgi:hypothetical protein